MDTSTASILTNPSVASKFRQDFVRQIEYTVQSVHFDVRDPWPTSMGAYETRAVLSKGTFGAIQFAVTTRNDFMSTDGSESCGCVIKNISMNKLFDMVIQEARATKKPTLLQIKSPEARLQRIIRRIVMELFVTSRCRHENILHLHAAFVDADGLHLVMPRFHVLKDFIELYKESHNFEPIPMSVIAPIVRQLCKALDYIHSIGIVHRDVQPENILLTRNGTVKLYHFGQSKALVTEKMKAECRTPTGKEGFMCSEKLYNLRESRSLDDSRPYSFDADIWSVGILILNMISYFPNEKFQKLPKDFARVLDREQMPFVWLTSEMVQLRARLLKSGGEDLKSFLNDHLFTFDPAQRLTARGILESDRFLRWCSPTVLEDKQLLKKKFIDELDFSNRQKLTLDGNNFDALESKNIPAEFYWDDTWKTIEHTSFLFKILSCDSSSVFAEKCFLFSDPEPLFEAIYAQLEKELIGLADIIAIHCDASQMAFDLIRDLQAENKKRSLSTSTVEMEPVILREYQPCQDFSANRRAPILLQMSVSQQMHRTLSSCSIGSALCSSAFGDTN